MPRESLSGSHLGATGEVVFGVLGERDVVGWVVVNEVMRKNVYLFDIDVYKYRPSDGSFVRREVSLKCNALVLSDLPLKRPGRLNRQSPL
jgi:hypothetical protein